MDEPRDDETDGERAARETREALDSDELVNSPDDASPTGTPSDGVASNEGRPISAAGSLSPSAPVPPDSIPPAERPEQAGATNPVLDNVMEQKRNEDGTLVNDTDEEKAARAGLAPGELKGADPING